MATKLAGYAIQICWMAYQIAVASIAYVYIEAVNPGVAKSAIGVVAGAAALMATLLLGWCMELAIRLCVRGSALGRQNGANKSVHVGLRQN